jgi:hypothetical protein
MTGNATITRDRILATGSTAGGRSPATGLRAAAGTGNTAVTGGHVPAGRPVATGHFPGRARW